MKWLLPILILWSTLTYAQYPIVDNFTSIGGVGEWYNQSGQPDMGVEGGTLLCYNLTSVYNSLDDYEWRSPDYSTQFVDDGCDSISIRFNVNYQVRGNDFVFFGAYDNGVWTDYWISGGSGTYGINLPKTSSQFRFWFSTFAGSGKNGKYVHFDWFEIGCYKPVPLPIELVFFTAVVVDQSVLLEWLTETEINNDYFQIIAMKDSISYNVLGTVDGAGNKHTPTMYSFVDNEPSSGDNYYKLIQYDYDGHSTIHKLVHINIDKKIERDIRIYPNPAYKNNNINVALNGFDGQEVLLVVVDVMGKIFYEKAIVVTEEQTIAIINSKLPTGLYTVIGSNRQELYQKQLIIK